MENKYTNKKVPTTQEDKDLIVELYCSGLSLNDVANKTGIGFQRVLKACEERNVVRRKTKKEELIPEEIIAEYKELGSVKKVAAKHHVTDRTIEAILRKSKLIERKSKDTSEIPEETLAKIRELYAEKYNPRQISEMVNVTQSRVTNYLKKTGLYKTKGESFTEDELRRLYVTERKTIREIAILRNCSPKKVQLALEKFNIEKEIYQYQFSKQELEDLYVKHNLSMQKIADVKGLSVAQVKQALQTFGINQPALPPKEDRTAYLNDVYGKGNWTILNKESFRKAMLANQ